MSTPDSSLQHQQQQLQQRATSAGDAASGSSAAHHVARQVEAVRRRVLEQYGSTGALLALTTAIAMRPPRVVFPVADLQASAGQTERAGAVVHPAGTDCVRGNAVTSPDTEGCWQLLSSALLLMSCYVCRHAPPYQPGLSREDLGPSDPEPTQR